MGRAGRNREDRPSCALTGPAAADGEEFVRGVEWAIEEANAKGGVAGYTFELEVADVRDQSAANVSSAAER